MNTDEFLYKLNNASRDELRVISRIGPVLADRLLAARPFQSIDDVKAVKGVSTLLLEKLVDQGESLPEAPAETNQHRIDEYPVEVESALSADASHKETDEKLQPGIPFTQNEPGNGTNQITQNSQETPSEEGAELPKLEEGNTSLDDDHAELEGETSDLQVEPEQLAEVAEEDNHQAEEAAAQSINAEASGPLEAPNSKEEAAPPPVETHPRPVEQPVRIRRSFWNSLLGSTITILAAILLTLAILGGINGSLSFVSSSQYRTMGREAAQLTARVDAIQQDLEGLRGRVDTLEGLGGRTIALEEAQKQLDLDMKGFGERADILEQSQQQLAAELESAGQKVAVLEAEATALSEKLSEQEERTSRFETFLEGLQSLLGGLFPVEGEPQ